MLSRNAEFNAVNRGVYIADNIDFLRSLNTASVDLVCIDPPFAKSDTFIADKLRPPLTQAERDNEMRLLKAWGIATAQQADDAGIAWPDDPKARGGYKDTWAWDEDIHEDWITGIETTHPAVGKLLDATRYIHGEDTAAYLSFMAIRLIEIHRILKPTGSLYLHCDHSANSYLRQLLDGVFGRNNAINQLYWRRTGSDAKGSQYDRRTYADVVDTIFLYAKSDKYSLLPYRNLDESAVAGKFPFVDENGERYNRATPLFCSPTMGPRPNLCYEWRGFRNPHPSGWRLSKKRLEEEYQKGNVVIMPDGKLQRRSYLRDYKGVPASNLWAEPGLFLGSVAKERTGYPTQKPYKLAQRIIQASTNPGDVVLDCFAGCAYVAVAAEKLDRRWTACDINLRAWTVFKRQFNKGGDLPLLTCNDETTGQQVLGCEPTVTLHGPAELPTRTTSAEVEIKPIRTASPRDRRYKRASTLMTDRAMLIALLQFSAGRAWCCGYISDNLDHSLAYGNYELDHVIPKSAGGTDEIENRAPLCSAHNGLKGNRDITLVELRYEVIERGELKVPARSLPKLSDAFEYALRVKQEAYQRKFGRPLGV